MALKIDKNEQKARKLWPPQVGVDGALLFGASMALKIDKNGKKTRKLKRTISKQFKSLNLKCFFWRKLCTDEVRGIKMKKNEKNVFCNSKKCIFFTALLGCSFAFAFQR
jgi:hypothetical protein